MHRFLQHGPIHNSWGGDRFLYTFRIMMCYSCRFLKLSLLRLLRPSWNQGILSSLSCCVDGKGWKEFSDVWDDKLELSQSKWQPETGLLTLGCMPLSIRCEDYVFILFSSLASNLKCWMMWDNISGHLNSVLIWKMWICGLNAVKRMNQKIAIKKKPPKLFFF